MLEWLTAKVLDKLADWAGGKLAGGRAWMKVRGALEAGGGLENASVDATIAAALEQLVSEPFLNSEAAQPAVKEWLQAPEVQRAFSNYVLGVQGSDSSLASAALRVLAAEYAARTGEDARLAEGRVRQAADYVSAQVKREPAHLTLSAVVELLARQRSESQPAPADDRLGRLRTESLTSLNALPVAVPLVNVAVPALFALASGERRAEPVPAEAIAALLIDGESVLIHGTGGAGKTTCLAEVAKLLAQAPKRPIPLYLSASEWAFSGRDLLDHVCGQPAVLRAGVSKDDASRLIEERRLVLLVDGWNEVAAVRRAPLVASVGQFLRGHPSAVVVSTSRTLDSPFKTPNTRLAELLALNWARQRTLVRAVLPADKAESLIQRLGADNSLRVAARTPLVLAGAIALHKSDELRASSVFGILDSVQRLMATSPERQAALDAAPVHGQQDRYCQAIAARMASRGGPIIDVTEALVALSIEQDALVQGHLVDPEGGTRSILDVLAGSHVLHKGTVDKDGKLSVQFVHERFQELFAAKWLLVKAGSIEPADGIAIFELSRDVLNWPAWTEPLRLAADELARNPNNARVATVLVKSALAADLRMACQLIGRLGVTAAPVVERVRALLEQLDACEEPAAKQYSLACKALTHWPEFSDVLERALLDADREAVYSFAHDMRELSVRSFRPDLLATFLGWPPERQEDFVGSLGTFIENADFLFHVATSNAPKDVRAKAIATLAWEYGGTSATMDAWLAAPDEVKDSHEGMQAILYRLGDAEEQPAVLENILRLAAANSSRNLLLDAARELPLAQGGFAVEAAKAELLEQHRHNRDEQHLLDLVRHFDKDALPGMSAQLILSDRRLPDWAAGALESLAKPERSALFKELWPQLRASENQNVDAASLGLIADSDALKEVFADYFEAETPLRNICWRLILASDTAALTDAVLRLAPNLEYKNAEAALEALMQPQTATRWAKREQTIPRGISPEAMDRMVEVFWPMEAPGENPSHGLRAHLCLMMSRADPQKYFAKILEGAMLEEAQQLKRRKATNIAGIRVVGLSYSDQFMQAALLCGRPMGEALWPLYLESDREGFLREVLVEMVVRPWRLEGSSRHPSSLDPAKRAKRIQAGRVLQQKVGEDQELADGLAATMCEELRALALVDPEPQGGNRRRWWMLTKVCEMPSRNVLDDASANLLDPRIPVPDFVYAANALVSQGLELEGALAEQLSVKWQERTTGQKWYGQNDTSLEELACLHFFTSRVTDGALTAVVDAWAEKSSAYRIAEKLKDVGTPAAMQQLSRLSLAGKLGDQADSVYVLSQSAEGLETLFNLVASGELFTLGDRALSVFRLSNSLSSVVEGHPSRQQALVAGCIRHGSGQARQLAYAVMSEVEAPDVTAIGMLLDTLDAGDDFGLVRAISKLFQQQRQIDSSPNLFEMAPRQMNDVRNRLYALATQRLNKTAALALLELEEARRSNGRPWDEPMNPRIESAEAWPIALVPALKAGTAQ